MWLHLAVAVVTWVTIVRGEIFDVTTIYDLSTAHSSHGEVTGRVHVRTNALGLPLINGDYERLNTEDINLQQLNLTCDMRENGHCNWDYDEGWKVENVAEEIKTGKEYRVNGELTSIHFKISETYDVNEPVYIYFPNSLIFAERKGILIRVYLYHSEVVLFKSCSHYPGYPSSYSYTVQNENESFVVFCETRELALNFQLRNDYISFKFSGGIFQFYKNSELKSEISDFAAIDVLRFKVYFGRSLNRYEPIFIVPGLSSTTLKSEITSSLVMLENADKLCLTLLIWSSNDVRQDVLHVLAEDLHYKTYVLQSVNHVKAGWNVVNHCLHIEKSLNPFRLIVKNEVAVVIARISTYSPRGEDVWPVTPIKKSSLLNPVFPNHSELSEEEDDWPHLTKSEFYPNKWSSIPKAIYGVEMPGMTNEKTTDGNFTNKCLNGGVMTFDGCACLPGYSGKECEIACGKNRFGLDCSVMCSLRSKMCRDLLLCNSITGCHCAPGYTGVNCNNTCGSSTYGNDCEQNCGRCLSDSCDIYTGKCQSCEFGYVPPYCKKAYVYYASKPELSSTDYGTITVKFNPLNNAGIGTPKLYQIQYREQNYVDWQISTTKIIETNEFIKEEQLGGLKTGLAYEVRVVLMDANFNKYDGDLIQASKIVTKCDIPEKYDYKMKTDVNATSITVSWKYTNLTEHWCPVEKYEVSWEEGWEWKKSYTSEEFFTLNDFLPNLNFRFRVHAITSRGNAPSSEVTVSTQYDGNYEVRDLRIVASHSTSAVISWHPPRDEDVNKLYKITYECLQQPACLPGCVNATEGVLTQDQTSVTLAPLLPFAQYKVTVAPEGGPGTSIYVGTDKIVPSEVPKPSAHSTLKTNTSLTVFWEAVPVCSSFLLGYNYQLYKESDSTKFLDSGFTKNTNTVFQNLTASTEYHVKVFVVTVAGWNPDAFLEIKSATSATVPDAVRNMTVYKRGRNSLGLRWAAPHATYGTLKAFTISYSLGKEEVSKTVQPAPCVPWPQLYCHTLEGLKTNRKYNVSVSARNSEVAEDGERTSVTAITKESPPLAPEGLKLINSSSTSINIEWCYPNLANGIIRSFLVSIEETEQFDQDSCCQIFPLVEIPVQEERLNYNTEVPGLHPASTYFVSVSAKTVGLGSSQSFSVHTKPPHQPFSALPRLQQYGDASWLPQEPQLFNQSEVYVSLIKAHILLLVDKNGTVHGNDTGILNPQLNSVLQAQIDKPFYFYQEYHQGDLDSVSLSFPSDFDSAWGTSPSYNLLMMKQEYHLVAAQVSEYNNEFNVDLRYFSVVIPSGVF